MSRTDPAGEDGSPADPLVVLVDARGHAIGTFAKVAAHRSPGRLHRAVSVLLLDGHGDLILQRRAQAKYHSAGRWGNSCCGHPQPGEPPARAARRRVGEELGIDLEPGALIDAGIIVYRVVDPGSGLVEHEYDHLFVGRTELDPVPTPSEVEAVTTVPLEDTMPRRLAGDGFVAWYAAVVEAARPSLLRLAAERRR